AETDQLDAVLVEHSLKLRFESGAVLAERLALDDDGRNSTRPRPFQPRRAGAIGNHDGDFGRVIRSRRSLDQRGHVRAATGNQDGDFTFRDLALHALRSRWPL